MRSGYCLLAAIALASCVLIAAGVRGLKLEAHGLALPFQVDNALFEQMPTETQAMFYIVDLEVPRAMTWDEFGNERGLSSTLVEETFACTSKGRVRKFADLKNTVIEARDKLKVVVKPGACKQSQQE